MLLWIIRCVLRVKLSQNVNNNYLQGVLVRKVRCGAYFHFMDMLYWAL